MTASITLFCNGCADACTATFVAAGGNTADARSAAHAGGWRHNLPRGKDYCPRCVRERRVNRLHSRPCRLCAEHPDVEFRSLLGHDQVGHRAANALGRFGVHRLRDLQQLPEALLPSVPGLGEACITRTLSVLEMHQPNDG